MKLVLEQYLLYEADKEIRCDATEMFWSCEDRKEIVLTCNEVVALFNAKKGLIYLKDKAVYMEFKDEKTNEISCLNCRKSMHELMLKYMLYPPVILNAFK